MKLSVKCLSAAVLGAAFALPVAAEGPAIDFDRGTDLGAVIESARAAGAPEWSSLNLGSSLNITRDCKLIAFKAEDPLVSQPVQLTSYVHHKVCAEYQGQTLCHDELLRTEKRNVSVALLGKRTALPWERDVFNICLKDTALTAEVIEASHRYKITKKAGPEDCVIQAMAKSKLKTEPDADGVSLGSWGVSQAGGLELSLNDKWAVVYGKGIFPYYKGEQTLIKVTLKMEKTNWFDPVILEKELLVAPADVYSIDFSKYAAEFRQPLEPGQKYFVKWGFRRKGHLSRESFVTGGETERVFLPLP